MRISLIRRNPLFTTDRYPHHICAVICLWFVTSSRR